MHLALARHQLRKDLDAERKKANSKSSQKSNFIRHLSHEIRNPLNSILGTAELLDQTQLNPEQKELIQTLIASSSQLMMVVNDVLDLSKIEEGKIPLFIEPVCLSGLVEQFKHLCHYQLSLKGLQLLVDIDSKMPSTISTDARRLKQILFNLLLNAIKFTDHGEIVLSVTQNLESRIRFEVKDSGRGIPDNFIPKLFASFSQAEQEDNKTGTGLGLNVCKRIMNTRIPRLSSMR